MRTFRDIIETWPTPDVLATEVGANAEAVRKWRQRDSIPAEWWLPVVNAGKARGIRLSVDEFVTILSKRT